MAQMHITRNDILLPTFRENLTKINNGFAVVALNNKVFRGSIKVTNMEEKIPTVTLIHNGSKIELISDTYNNGYLHTFNGMVVNLP